MRTKIGSWVRQARHRANRHDCINQLDLRGAIDLIDEYDKQCAYCGKTATGLDHAFPLADKAPNVLANILPICKTCKKTKKNKDLVAYRQDGNIEEEKYLELIRDMLTRPGNQELRDHIRSVTGIGF